MAVAGAFGGDAGVVGQSDVDEATVGGRHGFERDGPVTGDSAFGHPRGKSGDLPLSAITVLLNVDDHGTAGVFTPAEDDVDHVLESAQGLTPRADDEAGVFALDVDDGWVVRPGSRGSNGGRGVDAHGFEQMVDDAKGFTGVRGRAGDERYADACGFRADAEDTGAAVTNDVYLYRVAADAEFLER